MSTIRELKDAVKKFKARSEMKNRPHCKECPVNKDKCKQKGCAEIHNLIELLKKAIKEIESENERDKYDIYILKRVVAGIEKTYFKKNKKYIALNPARR